MNITNMVESWLYTFIVFLTLIRLCTMNIHTEWACYTGTCDFGPCTTPVSLSNFGQVQCFSLNGRDCDFKCCSNGDISGCNIASAVPLECGEMHATFYNGTGYLIDHWCNNACIDLFYGNPDQNNCNPNHTEIGLERSDEIFTLPFIDIACWLPEKAGNMSCQLSANETGVPLSSGSYLSQLVIPEIGFSLFFNLPLIDAILNQTSTAKMLNQSNATKMRRHLTLTDDIKVYIEALSNKFSGEAKGRLNFCQPTGGKFGTVIVDPCKGGYTKVHLYDSAYSEAGVDVQECFEDCNGEKSDGSCTASTGNAADPNVYSCVTTAPGQDAWLWDDGPSAPWEPIIGTSFYNTLFYGAWVWHDWCYHHNPITFGQTKENCDEISYRITNEICDHFSTLFLLRKLYPLPWTPFEPIIECSLASELYYLGVRKSEEAFASWNAANTLVQYGRPLDYPVDMKACKETHEECVKCVRYNSAHPNHPLDLLSQTLYCIECQRENGFFAYFGSCTEKPFSSAFFPFTNTVTTLETQVACRQVSWPESLGSPSPLCLYSQPCSKFPLTNDDPVDSINFCQHVGYVLNSSRDSTCPDADGYCWVEVVVPYKDSSGSSFFKAWTPSGIKPDLSTEHCIQNDGVGFSRGSFISMCGSMGNNVVSISSVHAWWDALKGNSEVCNNLPFDPTVEYAFKTETVCNDPFLLGRKTNNDTDEVCYTEVTITNNDVDSTPTEVALACKKLWAPGSIPSENEYNLIGGEITCGKSSYELEPGKWKSPRPPICEDVELAASAFNLTLTPGCCIWFWCLVDAMQWIVATRQVYDFD
jgi:hypothetical protein